MELSIFTESTEFLAIISISIFMAISPGPDFFMVSRNSIVYNKTAGIYAAIGISLAIWLHVAYSIAGLAILISKSIFLFSIIKYIGAAYLIFIGFKTIFSKSSIKKNIVQNKKVNQVSKFESFKVGFITNALNPKTTIFFLSIFTQIVNVDTSLVLQIIYGAIISLAHFIWFYSVAYFFSHPLILSKFQRYQKRIETFVGAALIIFGIKVAFTKAN
ncbi:LysE family translocator [Ancylomarina sp.]|uniref:LysE family translocator n=1 Tax=Ancylomarina sp. TaxID=1970196 RepID=UPI00356552B4